ncbi:uncharacterized protein [Nicotiana tomentosiformis]|uniref:uncharacterized protein n=1 Tax=Nicotiana tomentosiformis TaxID=4098 RepID=UPI00388C87E8
MVQHLTLKLYDTEDHKEFILTLVYAKCDHIERIELWDSLYYLARDMTIPWLVEDDFNVIWDEEEKFGGLPVSLNEVDDFMHCMDTCNLTDMGLKESIYNWWNERAEEDCIFKRLDRVFANMELQQLWPGLEITRLSKIGSYHCPLLLTYNPDSVPIKKSFRFLKFWTEHESYKAVVKENWQADFHANPFILFNHKIKRLKKALSTWSRVIFGDIFQKIDSLEEVVRVHEAQFELNPMRQNRKRLQKVQAELIKYLTLEEKFWKQKSGMTWFNDGDRNTNFIHAHAVYGLNSDSAGGPDGFNGSFFHSCWDIIGDDVVEMAGFVKVRSIVENVLLTQEIITDIRLRIKAGPNVVIKLDMTKAYDRLLWIFLNKMLRKMGFVERFISWVFGIISNNWYSVLINGQPHGFFKSTRGVK